MSRSALLRSSPAQEPWPRTHLNTSRVSLSRHLTSRADAASYLVYVGRHMPLAKGRDILACARRSVACSRVVKGIGRG